MSRLCGPTCALGKSVLTWFLRCPFNSLSVSPPLSPSWWRCVSASPVEFWPVPTFSVSTQSFSCRWTRRSPRGLAPSVTSPLPSRCSSLMGEEFLKPALTSSVCSFFEKVGASCWTVIQPTVFPLSKEFPWMAWAPGEGVYLWFVVSLLLPSCPLNQHSGHVCSLDLIYWICAFKETQNCGSRI